MEAAEKKRGSRGEARKQRRREESRKKKEEKTKVSMNLDDDRILSIFVLQQITNPISCISIVFLLVLAHPGGRREGQRRASIVSQ